MSWFLAALLLFFSWRTLFEGSSGFKGTTIVDVDTEGLKGLLDVLVVVLEVVEVVVVVVVVVGVVGFVGLFVVNAGIIVNLASSTKNYILK